MVNSKLEIIISARDLASGVLGSITGATRAYSNTLHDLNGAAAGVAATIRNLALSFGGFSVIKQAVQAGYAFNQTIEDTRVGIAGLIYAMNEFTDTTGAVVTGQKAFDAALRVSEAVQDRLRIAGLETAATFEQLVKAYSQAYVPALEAGFDEKKVVSFTVAVTQAATAMRIPLDMLGEEVRSILSGTMGGRTTLLKPLMDAAGLTNEKIASLRKEGKLYEAVMKALEGSTIAAAEASKNFSVMLSNLKDALSQALGTGLAAGFEQTKQYIKDLTDSIVTFDKETGEIIWNESLLAYLRQLDQKIFSVIGGIRDLGVSIAGFAKNHPVITDLAVNFGGLALKIGVAVIALKAIGGLLIWLKASAAASIAYIATLFGGLSGALSTFVAGGVMSLSVFAGYAALAAVAVAGIGSAIAGWQIGKWISQWEIFGLTIAEALQAGYASVGKFFAYCVYAWDMIGATAKAVWGGVKESAKILLREFVAAFAEAFPRLAKFFGIDENYRKKIEELRAAQGGYQREFQAAQDAAQAKLKKSLEHQEAIRQSIFDEADARKQVNNTKQAAAKKTDEITHNTKQAAAAVYEYSLAHRDVNQYLDRANDILSQLTAKNKDFAREIKKITATAAEIKLLDIEKAYEHDMAAIEKYQNDIYRQVRELQEKIQKAKEEAAKHNKKAARGDELKTIDPQVYKDLDELLAKQKSIHDQAAIAAGLAAQKRVMSEQAANIESTVRLKTAIAAQQEEYAKLTGSIAEQYAARAAHLRAKLAEELADVRKSAQEKAAIEKTYAEEIRQATAAEQENWLVAMQAGLRDYTNAVLDTYKSVQGAVTKAFKGMEDALVEFVSTGKLSFTDLVNSMIKDLTRLWIQKNITGQLSQNFGGGAGGYGAGGGWSGWQIDWGEIGGWFASLFHSGGIVGEGRSFRIVPAAAYADAPRFHNGFAPNEYPAILQRGEGVFTPEQMKALGTQTTPPVNITINALDSRSFEEYARRNQGAIIGVVNQSIKDRKVQDLWRPLLAR